MLLVILFNTGQIFDPIFCGGLHMQELKHYFQHHKQINIAAIWLLLASGVMLSLPTATLSLSGLEQWVNDYKGYLFITVIAGIAYFIAVMLVQVCQITIEKHEEKEMRHEAGLSRRR